MIIRPTIHWQVLKFEKYKNTMTIKHIWNIVNVYDQKVVKYGFGNL